MIIDNWINLIAAILVGGGTLFLGIMAWRTICQTRSIQKAEKRERLLNEIIEWATELSVARLGKDINIISLTGKDLINALFLTLSSVKSKSQYITHISSVFSGDLEASVEKATSQLQTLLGLLVNALEALESGKSAKEIYKEEGKSVSLLGIMANEIIDEATRIKTKDIGKEEENMSKEGEDTLSREPTIKGIEEHLKRQDRQMARGTYFSGYIFGATLIFIAFGLLAGKYVLTTELSLVTYSIVMLIGGTVLMGFAWYKRSKTPK